MCQTLTKPLLRATIRLFFGDMSYLSRSEGINALDALQEALKDASEPNAQLLRCGLELMLDQAPPKQVMEALTSRMDTQFAIVQTSL